MPFTELHVLKRNTPTNDGSYIQVAVISIPPYHTQSEMRSKTPVAAGITAGRPRRKTCLEFYITPERILGMPKRRRQPHAYLMIPE